MAGEELPQLGRGEVGPVVAAVADAAREAGLEF